MRFNAEELVHALRPLVGKRAVQFYHAGDMRGLLFRAVSEGRSEQSPEWCLHVSCTWRLEHGEELVTGTYDWLKQATSDDKLSEEWDPAEGGSRQESILRSLLMDIPGEDRTIWNHTDLFILQRVQADSFGGFSLLFNDDYRLVAFPSTTHGELWRVFLRSPDAPHFLVEAAAE